MPLASTSDGALYYEVIDRVAPWEQKRDPILFHHGIGASAGIWTEWIAALQRFHLVGESIGGTIGLAATLARPDRIATLTVSNGGHLGASIQRVDEWRRQLDELGVKGWSDIFMRDRFHEDALAPERWAWFAQQQEAWTQNAIL